ncbi:hypothetical protein HPB49_023110 [Dermacentor silvarum]|uniref:Uncharacterized protein n=1 Tax=Dermacentor silvarum TaxID=543639 RepID=A0ACB8DL39_DERSI|nr:hypothetical protein HPB49_023110 [Dermacentor silvarum]
MGHYPGQRLERYHVDDGPENQLESSDTTAAGANMASEQLQQDATAASLQSGGTDNATESSKLLDADASMTNADDNSSQVAAVIPVSKPFSVLATENAPGKNRSQDTMTGRPTSGNLKPLAADDAHSAVGTGHDKTAQDIFAEMYRHKELLGNDEVCTCDETQASHLVEVFVEARELQPPKKQKGMMIKWTPLA